jgi:hypothetical protein
MRESIDASEVARDLLPHVAQTNPPPWFHILEELLNLANACVYTEDAKAHPQTNASLPVVNCGKNPGADSGDLS